MNNYQSPIMVLQLLVLSWSKGRRFDSMSVGLTGDVGDLWVFGSDVVWILLTGI